MTIFIHDFKKDGPELPLKRTIILFMTYMYFLRHVLNCVKNHGIEVMK